jgi:hypothetical protein
MLIAAWTLAPKTDDVREHFVSAVGTLPSLSDSVRTGGGVGVVADGGAIGEGSAARCRWVTYRHRWKALK